MLRASKRKASVLGTLLVAGLLVFVLAPAPAQASTLVPAAQSGSSWSYGVLNRTTILPQNATNGWQYQGNATLGYTVTIFENSTNATTFELSVFRTMGLAYSVEFCNPSCAAAHEWANETFRLYETTATFANFTTLGVVTEGTSPVPAIALANTTSFLHANLTESTDVFLTGERGPHLGYLGANLLAKSAVSFSPALGFVPTQLSPGATWNSTASFSAQGSSAWSYFYSMRRPVAPFHVGPISGGELLTGTGTVSLLGTYPAGGIFRYQGANYPAIFLVITGPFDVREGVIFIPTPADLFGSSSQPWETNQTGSASVSMGALDLKSAGGDRLQPIASSMHYASATANAASTTQLTPGSSGSSVAATTSNPLVNRTLQGEPESQDVAQGTQNCLTTGTSCNLPSNTTSSYLVELVVVAGAVATIGALVAVAVVARRRRTPPPVYPNAVLYPPGAAHPSAPAGAPAPPPSPPPSEDDPLSHLW